MSLTRSLIPQQHRPILDQLLVRLSLRQGQPEDGRRSGGLRTRKKAAGKNKNVAFFSTAAEREEFEPQCSKWLINKGVGALFPMASTTGLYQRNFLFDNVFATDAANR
jgi:hypothetical protein